MRKFSTVGTSACRLRKLPAIKNLGQTIRKHSAIREHRPDFLLWGALGWLLRSFSAKTDLVLTAEVFPTVGELDLRNFSAIRDLSLSAEETSCYKDNWPHCWGNFVYKITRLTCWWNVSFYYSPRPDCWELPAMKKTSFFASSRLLCYENSHTKQRLFSFICLIFLK
jgi:hypothetical protein